MVAVILGADIAINRAMREELKNNGIMIIECRDVIEEPKPVVVPEIQFSGSSSYMSDRKSKGEKKRFASAMRRNGWK